MATADGALPNFLIIGPMRFGSSSLAYYLRDHTDVFMSRTKELHFFTDRFDPGLDWYRYQFRESRGHTARASLERVVNPNIRVRSAWVPRATQLLPKRLRNLGARVNAPPADHPHIDPAVRAEFARAFEPENDALAAGRGRDLSAWRN